MKKSEYVKYLVPVVAVLVIAESVVLVTRLGKGGKVVETNGVVAEKSAVKEEKPVATMVVEADKKVMKKGAVATVAVVMSPLEAKKLDAVNLYLKCDTEAFEVSKIVYDARLPKPAFEKVSAQKKMVVANFLITEPEGLAMSSGEKWELVKFEIKAKKTGNFELALSRGEDGRESTTMLVESVSSKALPFSASGLTINVSN